MMNVVCHTIPYHTTAVTQLRSVPGLCERVLHMLKIESEDVIANEHNIDAIMKGIWQKAMTYTVADPVCIVLYCIVLYCIVSY